MPNIDDTTSRPPSGHHRLQGVRRRPPLPLALIAAAVPAYLFPALTTAANALVIPNREIAASLSVAAWTTIAIPSAAASVIVTLWNYWRTPPERPTAGRSARAFAIAALACVVLGGGGSALLIVNGVLPLSALQYTLSSAALGGGLAARRWARASRISRRAQRRQVRPASPDPRGTTAPSSAVRFGTPFAAEPVRLAADPRWP